MRIYGIRFTLIASLLALTFALTFAAWNGSATQNLNPQEATRPDVTPEDDLPLLDLKHAGTTPAPDQQKGKNRRGLRQDRQIAELPTGVEPLPLSSHALIRLPAIPAEQSNAIILGKVTDRHAVLTDDKLGIYSEFSIGITEIFKDDQNLFAVGQMVTTSRPGGAVRFPSGKTQRYTIFRQGYPQQGKIYILFLKRDEEGDFSILTGYEVDGTVVQPLDGKRNSKNKEDELQFDIYRGVSRESFITALQKALQQAGGDLDQ